MFNKLAKIAFVAIAALGLTACDRTDIDVSPTEVAYLYKTDIYDSERYNPGSDYEYKMPFQTKYQLLVIDYATVVVPFNIKYTLTDKENKTTVESTAKITFRLKRNKEDHEDYQFSEDKIAQFFTQKINAVKNENIYRITPQAVFNRLMNETLDRVFREEYTNQELYPDFDSIEKNVTQMRDSIKEKLIVEADKHNIEIIGLSIASPVVPEPIQTSRDKMLELRQNALNDTTELQIKANQAAARMAVATREALNDVVLDRIVSGNVDKGYLLIKTFNRAIDEKSPLNLSITPDFMRYLEKDSGSASKNDNDMFDTLNGMSDEELKAFFSRSPETKKQ
jgi:hypothetical protein